jgi:PAS domain S-box-containing protein
MDIYVKAFYRSPAAICVTSIEGHFIEVNESFCHLAGFNREEVIGRTSTELNLFTDPWDRNKALDLLNRHGSLKQHKSRVTRKDGGIRDCVRKVEIVDMDGKPGVLMMLLDVTPGF